MGKIDSFFREKAQDQLFSPEQIDALMVVVTPKGWVALFACFALIFSALIWSFVGVLPVEVNSNGIILTPKGLFNIVAPNSGIVSSFRVDVGDWVKPDSVIATLSAPEAEGGVVDVTSHACGQILEVYAVDGDWVKEGDLIALVKYPLEPGQTHTIQAFFPIRAGELITPGMDVKISPGTVNPQIYGYMKGKVKEVSEFPISNRSILNHLRNPELVQFMKQGDTTVLRVTIDPIADPHTPSGYLWTTKEGPPQYLQAGTICSVRIAVSEKRPISYLLPLFFNHKQQLFGPNPDICPEGKQ